MVFQTSPHQGPSPAPSGSGLAAAAVGGLQSWTRMTPPAARTLERVLDVAQRLLEAVVAVDEDDVEVAARAERGEEDVAGRADDAPAGDAVGVKRPLQRGICGLGSTPTLADART